MKAGRRIRVGGMLAGLATLAAGSVRAQAPTIAPPPANVIPGGMGSRLGQPPGSGGDVFGPVPGAGMDVLGPGVLGGRPGTSVPRVPPSVAVPGGMTGPMNRPQLTPPNRLQPTVPPLYGSLALPTGAEEEGPPNGLTLDAAIDFMVRNNLDLRSKFYELPQAQADVLTASLRANPIFFWDSQLNPYGKFSPQRPGGPNQYDVNFTQPLDLSHKRQARTLVARQALHVLEARYQDAVRLQIDNLYTAYLDVLAARESVRYARTSLEQMDRVLVATYKRYKGGDVTSVEYGRVQSQRDETRIGLEEAEEILRRTKRTLGTLLGLRPEQGEQLELRASLLPKAPPLPPFEVLAQIALESRPDLVSYRLGIGRARADVQLARANRFTDVYLLYQPYTFQNDQPFGLKSATSWAVGMTMALPVFNQNQGNIQRARLNVDQTQIEYYALINQMLTEVRQAERDYKITGDIVRDYEARVEPPAHRALEASEKLYRGGEAGKDVTVFLNDVRLYSDVVRKVRDARVRHRRSMLTINTVVGRRIMP